MRRRSLASRGVITLVFILQLVPLILFPLEPFAPTTHEGWLHATGANGLNGLYIVLTLVVMALSVFLLWYTELPDVRLGFVRK